ncbi:MAG TPA: hypothetical protein V6C76_01845 [Drouetiella sp.]
MTEKQRHRRHRAHDEQGREMFERHSCVPLSSIREDKRAANGKDARKARIARNRAAKKR